MSAPVKRTQWDEEDLTQFREDHGLSKKVLLNCCLIRRIISWASPNKKGKFLFEISSIAVVPPNMWMWILVHMSSILSLQKSDGATLDKIKLLYWCWWFYEDYCTSMELFHSTKGSLQRISFWRERELFTESFFEEPKMILLWHCNENLLAMDFLCF